MEYRNKLNKEFLREAENKKDLIGLGNSLNNDKDLLKWIIGKAEEICQILAILSNYQKLKDNVTEALVLFVINNILKPCNSLHITTGYKIYPDTFGPRVNEFFNKYLLMYQQQWMDSNNYKNLITLDDTAISGIWKYISILTISLMTKIKRNKQVNPRFFLENIQNQLTNSQEDCVYNGSLDLTRKQKCIISAIINLANSLQMLDNTAKLSSILINCVGSIILGKTYVRNISKADKNIFKEIKDQLNFANIDKDKIIKLDILFKNIDEQTTEDVDISTDNSKIMNRVNFFSTQDYDFTLDLRFPKPKENIEQEVEEEDLDQVIADLVSPDDDDEFGDDMEYGD